MTVLNWLDLSDDELWRNPTKQPEHGKNAFGERIPTPANDPGTLEVAGQDRKPDETATDDTVESGEEASLDDESIASSEKSSLEQEPLTDAREGLETDEEAVEEVVVEQVFGAETEDAGAAIT